MIRVHTPTSQTDRRTGRRMTYRTKPQHNCALQKKTYNQYNRPNRGKSMIDWGHQVEKS